MTFSHGQHKDEWTAAAVTLMIIGSAFPVSVGGLSYLSNSNIELASAQPWNSLAADAIGLPLYFNGSLYTGAVNFNATPGSHLTLHITETYPWSEFSSISPSSRFLVNLSLGPFPVQGSVASWLHISVPSVPLAIAYGQNASFNMHLSLDKLIATQGGITSGSFELESHYIDPVTGRSATEVNVIKISPLTSTVTAAHPGDQVRIVEKIASAWAMGVGLCDSSSTGQCNYYGIGWSSVNAVEASVTTFTWASGNSLIMFNLNASPAHPDLLQAEAVSPYGGSGNWEYRLEFLTQHTDKYTYMWSLGSSGSFGFEILNDVGCTDKWAALQGGTENCFSAYLSNCCNNTSYFYAEAQEPVAFESYDSTQSHFNSKLATFGYAFKYSTNDGSTWNNPPTGMYVDVGGNGIWNANNHGYIIGGGASTPSWFLMAGALQCTLSKYVVEVGISGTICSAATNTYDTQLF